MKFPAHNRCQNLGYILTRHIGLWKAVKPASSHKWFIAELVYCFSWRDILAEVISWFLQMCQECPRDCPTSLKIWYECRRLLERHAWIHCYSLLTYCLWWFHPWRILFPALSDCQCCGHSKVFSHCPAQTLLRASRPNLRIKFRHALSLSRWLLTQSTLWRNHTSSVLHQPEKNQQQFSTVHNNAEE